MAKAAQGGKAKAKPEEGAEAEARDLIEGGTTLADAPEDLTIDEFFDLPDLQQKGARIYVELKGDYVYDRQSGKKTEKTPPKTIKVEPGYWFGVLKDEHGQPFEPQELVGYELTQEGRKQVFKFSK